MIDTGQRDKLVTIQQLTESRGASGFPVESWSSLVTVFMAREDAGGRERFNADQRQAVADTHWTLLFREDMDPEAVDVPKHRRLLYRGRPYNIIAARPIGRRDSIELVTEASVG
jgi:SPP1 family predicted phage head-tail adaptor